MAPKSKYINCVFCDKKARSIYKFPLVVSEDNQSAVFYNYFVCTGKTLEEIKKIKKDGKNSELSRARGCKGKMLMDCAEEKFYNNGKEFDRFISKYKKEESNSVLYESDIKKDFSYFLNKGSTKRIIGV